MTWPWVVLILGLVAILAAAALLMVRLDVQKLRAEANLERARTEGAERRLQR